MASKNMNIMKKAASVITAITMLLSALSAYAVLEPTGPNTNSSNASRTWLANNQADVLVHKILDGNIAFVRDSQRVWVRDHVEEMNTSALYNEEDGSFTLPVDFVNTVFGLSLTGATVNSQEVESQSGLFCFVDPRGFLVFSESTDAVNTTLPTASYTAYKDYFTVADAMSFITWTDREFTTEERLDYIKKWQGALSIPQGCNRSDYSSFLNATINSANAEARKSVKGSFNSDTNRYNYIPEGTKLDGFDLSGAQLATFKINLRDAYKKVLTMATGYVCMTNEQKQSQNGLLLHDTILGCLDYLLGYYSLEWNYLYDSKQQWVITQFGLPFNVSNVLCLMYDEMTDAERKTYTDQMFDKAPLPNLRTGSLEYAAETYTNRLWKCYSYFQTAVLANDSERMNYAMKYSAAAYMYTYNNTDFNGLKFNKDGFYSDGSMVFHNSIPNNMGYGMSYVVLVYEFLDLTQDTKFDIRGIYDFDNVYQFCMDSILPFVTNGLTMRMVHGRANAASDTGIIARCEYISNRAPEPIRAQLTAKIKTALEGRTISATSKQYVINTPRLTEMAREFNDYANNIPEPEITDSQSHVYYNQDQIIHKANDFTATLAMSSSRIAKYECIAPTNGTGWYMGDGMLYVYKDSKQYNTDYFNNVNPYYMPGTTVDSTVRKVITTSDTSENWGLPDNTFAGGATDGKNTAAGYIMGNKYVSGLEGKKSYFMLGDKIVCMGTGISGGYGDVYTVIDNRIIDKEAENITQPDIAYKVKSITCSEPSKQDSTELFTDGNLSSSCPLASRGDSVTFDFGEKVDLNSIGMAFLNGNARSEYGTIQASEDGENFTDIYNLTSSGTTTEIEIVNIACNTRYLRIVANGNSAGNAWFNLSEIVFYKPDATAEEIEEAKTMITTGFNTFATDVEEQNPDFNIAHCADGAQWAWLEDEWGTVFLKKARLCYIREKQPSASVYMRCSIEHGESPEKESYAYIELPCASKEETIAEHEAPSVEIIEQTETVHAVFDKKQGIYAVNVFGGSYTLCGLTLNAPCSAIINPKTHLLYITDPTFKEKRITVSGDKTIQSLSAFSSKTDGNTITLFLSKMPGRTQKISYKPSSDSAEKDTLKVRNYTLKYAVHTVKTTLYARGTGTVLFEIVKKPVMGKAYIVGNQFYYCPHENGGDEKITVRAYTQDGHGAEFTVKLEKK